MNEKNHNIEVGSYYISPYDWQRMTNPQFRDSYRVTVYKVKSVGKERVTFEYYALTNKSEVRKMDTWSKSGRGWRKLVWFKRFIKFNNDRERVIDLLREIKNEVNV